MNNYSNLSFLFSAFWLFFLRRLEDFAAWVDFVGAEAQVCTKLDLLFQVPGVDKLKQLSAERGYLGQLTCRTHHAGCSESCSEESVEISL